MPRGWVDDLFESHPKRELVSLAADGLLMNAISIANRHLTDGFVSEDWMRKQLRREGRRARKVLDEALEAPLFERFNAHSSCTLHAPKVPGLRLRARPIVVGPFRLDGFLIHDFFSCNRARIEVEEKRAVDRDRKREDRGQIPLLMETSPPSVREDSRRTTSGSPGGVGSSTTSNGTAELDAHAGEEPAPGKVGEVMAILGRAERFQVTGMMETGIESAIAAYPAKDAIAAAHEAVVWVSDSAFRKTSPTAVFLDALRKQPEHVAVQAGMARGNVGAYVDEQACRCGTQFRRNDPRRRFPNAGRCDDCQAEFERLTLGEDVA